MTCLVSEHCGHSLSNQQDLPKHWKIVISDINSSCLLSVNKLLNWQTNLIAITIYFFHICFFVWRISWLVFSLSFIAWKMMDRTQLWRMSKPKQLRISTRILGTRLPLTSFTDLLYAYRTCIILITSLGSRLRSCMHWWWHAIAIFKILTGFPSSRSFAAVIVTKSTSRTIIFHILSRLFVTERKMIRL